MFWNRVSFVLIALLLASACERLPLFGDPLQEVDLLSEVELAEDVTPPQMMASEAPQRTLFTGLWDRLRGADPAPVVDQDPMDLDPLAGELQDVASNIEAPALDDAANDEVTTVAAPSAPERPRASMFSGVFDFLRADTLEGEGFTDEAPVNLARLTTSDTGPESGDAPPMSNLAFGALERTCGLSRRELGQQVAAASGFRIYDTNPGSTVMRPHYVTGFDDSCARQFSAALVLLGDVGTHEIVRYSRTGVQLEYSATDDAYEAIKAQFCRVGEGVPCGARLERLGKVATFVTAYRSFGAAPEWAEFLLYDGQVAAVDLEGL